MAIRCRYIGRCELDRSGRSERGGWTGCGDCVWAEWSTDLQKVHKTKRMRVAYLDHNSAVRKHDEDVEEGRILVLLTACSGTEPSSARIAQIEVGKSIPAADGRNLISSSFVRYIILLGISLNYVCSRWSFRSIQ